MFCEVVGQNPRNAILEFFLEGRGLDYGIGDVSRELKLNRATTYNVTLDLIKKKWIIPSRKVGITRLYKLNENDDKAKLLIKIFNEVLREGAKEYEK